MTDVEKLKDVRGQCRIVKDKYEEVRMEFFEKQARVDALEVELQRCDGELARHAMPQATDFPTDEELSLWQKEHDRLVAARQNVVNNRTEAVRAREVARLNALHVGNQLESLIWAERAMRNRISSGGRPVEDSGGIDFVS